MGVRIRKKDGKWYVFINHQGKRKARCIGDSKRAAEEVKRKLEANRLSTALFDTEGFTRRLERAYVSMWERHLAGQPAAQFDVD